MWPSTFCAWLILARVWVFIPLPARSMQPPDQNMTEMTQMFQDFMIQYNKSYKSPEEMHHRFKVFEQNLKASRELQASELGTAQYGVTQFSDLTESEFKTMFGIPQPIEPPIVNRLAKSPKAQNPPSSCDWRKFGAITEVKKQGSCRSCWAFAAASNIEALWNIHRHSPRNVSVQELVDCTSHGCSGGYVWDAFLTVINRSGLSSSKLYPYAGKDQRCQQYRRRQVTGIEGYEILPREERDLAEIVASQGPITVLFNMKALQQYKNGVIWRTSQDCSKEHLDHFALVVGYGQVPKQHESPAKQYWIIQNSWGKRWGEKGYFRLHRGDNTCGVAMFAVTAVVKNLGARSEARVLCPR
ncbi:PREDICTED: cathepsin W-like [Gekko japonicus]|uniref:Cathepsin W-like n=1 Tax=Gekko japonicus TaxID=146911 RepID=A0ABM1KPW9_GEKJA|nr:PREDICTED: cathepsin W-like [Gekko japonicus]